MSGLWSLSTRSLRARPLRSLVTIIAVALGVAAVIGVQQCLTALSRQAGSAQEARAGLSGLDVRVTADRDLTSAQVATLVGTPGIHRADPLLEKRITARADPTAAGLQATIVGVSDDHRSALRPVQLSQGRLPSAQSGSEVALDTALAIALGRQTGRGAPLHVGDSVLLTTGTGPDHFRVVGLTTGTTGGAAFTRSAVFVGADAMQRVFGLGLHTPLIALQLERGVSPAVVAASVRKALPEGVSTSDPRAGRAEPLADLRPLLVLVTGLTLVIGAGVTANNVSLAVYERRREIGLLRAAGASSRQVVRMLAIEVGLCALAGAVAGVIVGIGAGAALVRAFGTVGPAAGTAHPDLGIAAAAAAVGIVVALLGGLAPALGAGRLSPLEAVRPAANAGQEPLPRWTIAAAALFALGGSALVVSGQGGVAAVGIGLLLLAVAASLPLAAPPAVRLLGLLASPLAWQAPMAAASLARRRNRTALTTAGLACATATAVAVSVLTAGALAASDQWVSRVLVGDAIVHSGVTQPDALTQPFTAQRGVREVSPIRYFTENIGGQPVGFAAIDPAIYANRDGLDLGASSRATAFLTLGRAPSVFASRRLAEAHGWSVGSTLHAGVGGRDVALSVAGIVEHSLPTGDGGEALLIDRGIAVTTFGPTVRGFDDLQVVTDGDLLPTLQGIANRYGMQAVSVDTIRASAEDSLRHAVGLLFAVAGVSVVIAMLAVVNTLLVNVRQAARSISLLRAVGMARRRALRLLLAEAALLSALGVGAGVGVGCLVALPVLGLSAAPGFQPHFVFPLATVLAIVGAVVAGATFAALVPAARIARESIVAGIRYE